MDNGAFTIEYIRIIFFQIIVTVYFSFTYIKYQNTMKKNIPLIKKFGPISELLHGADIHIRRVLT